MIDKAIKEKLLKVKALAEKGVDGEKTTAQNILQRLKKKYGIEKLENDLKLRDFEFEDKHVSTLFAQCVYYLFNGKVKPYSYSLCGSVKIGDADFLYLTEFFEFHRTKYLKNRSSLLKNFTSMYIEKHDLFGSNSEVVEVSTKIYEKMQLMNSFITNEKFCRKKVLKEG